MIQPSSLSRLGLFDARVPRYTSYPSAATFAGGVGPGDFTDWASSLAPGSSVSLYLHVPFCRRLCWFCACRTQGTVSDRPVGAYLDALKAELEMLAGVLPPDVTLSRMHWGGGTPTILSAAMMADLAEAVAAVLPMAPGAEFSIEIDPNEIDAERMEALAKAGLTRASIGVQDFDPEIQDTIGRKQDFDVTRRAVELIRAHGIRSLNADIVYGLPHQTRGRITETVQKLLSFGPDRVALYGYAHVPWMARRQSLIPTDALPDPKERLELFDVARRLFVWDGYDEIGIDHFAVPHDGLSIAARTGRLRRNFQGYTDDTAEVLIGLGASAISRFPQGYAQNATATSAYAGKVREGRFATARGHVLSGEDRMRGRMIESLMCQFRIDADEIVRDFGIERSRLARLFDETNRRFEGLLVVGPRGLEIPPPARPLTRLVARAFDLHMHDPAGHSSAI